MDVFDLIIFLEVVFALSRYDGRSPLCLCIRACLLHAILHVVFVRPWVVVCLHETVVVCRVEPAVTPFMDAMFEAFISEPAFFLCFCH